MKKGFALLTVVLLLAILGVLGSSFVIITLGDLKIAESQENGIKAHYRAEAGIGKAIWMLDNDATWKNNFETNLTWTETLVENDYSISIKNIALGKAEITSTGTINTGKRVVKATVFKTLGGAFIDPTTAYSGQDIFIWGTEVDIDPDSLFSNRDIDIESSSDVEVSNKVAAVQNITVSSNSILTAGTIESLNNSPAPESVQMPMLDIDSAAPDSYKSQATSQSQVYSQTEFADMLTADPDLALSGVVYVTGDINIKRGQIPEITGVLVAEKNINIGLDASGSGFADLKIEELIGKASGLIAKQNITIGDWANSINIKGLIYTLQDFTIAKFFPTFNFKLNGGIIANNIQIWTLDQKIDIKHDDDLTQIGLGSPVTSPLITLEHWEEEY